MVRKALTVAGSDSGGGAGIQADLKTFQELGVYGMSALTAVTAQNTIGVQEVLALPVEMVASQIESVGADIGVDALKTGMLFSSEIIHELAGKIKQFGWTKLVVDPVMVAKGGSRLLQAEAAEAMKAEMLPLALIVTPNIPEAEVLTGMTIRTKEDKLEAARVLNGFGAKYVLIKGGHDDDPELAEDLLFDGQKASLFVSPRIHTKHTHGTGCTYSAAITAELAKGKSVEEAVGTAKRFINAAITMNLGIGNGHGPTNHWAYRKESGREDG